MEKDQLNIENNKAKARAYYLANKEHILAKTKLNSKAYYEKNKQEIKAAKILKYNTDEATSIKEYYKEYYKKNRSKLLIKARQFYYKNKDPTNKRYSVMAKQELIEKQLADLLVKKEAFKQKLLDEQLTNNNVDVV